MNGNFILSVRNFAKSWMAHYSNGIKEFIILAHSSEEKVVVPFIQNTLRVGNSETPFYAGFKVKIFDSNFNGEEGALIVQCWGKQVANGNVWGIVAMHPCLTVRVHATLTSNVSRQSHPKWSTNPEQYTKDSASLPKTSPIIHEQMFECQDCNREFKTKRGLAGHKCKARAPETRMLYEYGCADCRKSWTSEKERKDHACKRRISGSSLPLPASLKRPALSVDQFYRISKTLHADHQQRDQAVGSCCITALS